MSTVTVAKSTLPGSPRRLILPPPAPPARARSFWSRLRLSWLIGIIVLTGSLVGAGHVLHSRPFEQSGREALRPADPVTTPPAGVICHGLIEIENCPNGFVPLAPTQAGTIAEVLVYEGQNVRQGDILLRVDDEAAQQTVAMAELGVRLALAQSAKARRGVEQHAIGLQEQAAAIEASRRKVAAADAQLHRLEGLRERGLSNDDELTAARESIAALRHGVEAEEAKLRRLEVGKPDVELQEAEENCQVARKRLEQAKLVLKGCVLEAPSDGTILRLTAGKGALLGPQSRQAPVLFCPAGPRIARVEVEQEFAHRVQVGMTAQLQDEANAGLTWKGKIKRISPAFLPRRANGLEGMSLSGGSETRVLECIIDMEPGAHPPLIGQRLRVNLGTHGGA